MPHGKMGSSPLLVNPPACCNRLGESRKGSCNFLVNPSKIPDSLLQFLRDQVSCKSHLGVSIDKSKDQGITREKASLSIIEFFLQKENTRDAGDPK